jgi:NAD(P)-dependent dehydrogenase (short-subunit alcohol dehydrogenase family)
MNMNITHKHIAIASGSSGIGFAIAALALERGARVTILGRSKAKLADARQRLARRWCRR